MYHYACLMYRLTVPSRWNGNSIKWKSGLQNPCRLILDKMEIRQNGKVVWVKTSFVENGNPLRIHRHCTVVFCLAAFASTCKLLFVWCGWNKTWRQICFRSSFCFESTFCKREKLGVLWKLSSTVFVCQGVAFWRKLGHWPKMEIWKTLQFHSR